MDILGRMRQTRTQQIPQESLCGVCQVGEAGEREVSDTEAGRDFKRWLMPRNAKLQKHPL